MARLNDLTSNKVQERKRQVRTYGTKTDLASSTIDRGNTHWTQGSRVSIDGLLDVDGTMNVTGTLNGSGDINLSGSTEITGPLDITGATTIGGSLEVTGPTTLDGVLDIGGNTTITGTLDVTGPTTIKGTLGIEGVTTLKSDLNVITGGKIKAGQTTIEPTGKATFGSFIIDPNSAKLIEAPGGYVISNGADQVGLSSSSSSSVTLNSGSAVLDHKGQYVRVELGQTTVSNQLKVNSTPIKAASQLTPLGIDSNGVICRIG